MRKQFAMYTLIIMTALYGGCYYDKAELIYPNTTTPGGGVPGCDTLNMSYRNHIVPILSSATNKCYTCHDVNNAQSMGNGFRLDTYQGVKNMVNTANVDGSRLVRAVMHTGPSPMPKGGGKISNCDISKIRAWVAQGAKDN